MRKGLEKKKNSMENVTLETLVADWVGARYVCGLPAAFSPGGAYRYLNNLTPHLRGQTTRTGYIRRVEILCSCAFSWSQNTISPRKRAIHFAYLNVSIGVLGESALAASEHLGEFVRFFKISSYLLLISAYVHCFF